MSINQRIKRLTGLSLGLFLCTAAGWNSPAFAFNQYTLLNSNLSDQMIQDLLHTAALAVDHRPYMAATPMGYVIGLDVGVAVTAASVPSEFKQALSLATGQDVSQIPSVFPVPQLTIRKGLPKGIDLGFSFATSNILLGKEGLFSIYGGDIQWAFINGQGAKPAAAVRFSASSSNLWFLKTHTYALDVLVSKNLYVIDPYIGTGLKYWGGTLQLQPLQSLPYTVSGSHSGLNPHIFFGLPVKLLFLNITLESDYNFGGISTYGGKLSFNF